MHAWCIYACIQEMNSKELNPSGITVQPGNALNEVKIIIHACTCSS